MRRFIENKDIHPIMVAEYRIRRKAPAIREIRRSPNQPLHGYDWRIQTVNGLRLQIYLPKNLLDDLMDSTTQTQYLIGKIDSVVEQALNAALTQ